jgi:beta-1,4-mannosyltransferase
MRVIMYPAVGVQNENRYLDILVKGLRDIGVEVEGWTKHLSFQTGDVFHVHWPEIVSGIHERDRLNAFRGAWIAFQFFSTIRRIKKRGGRVVWTVHDLAPHAAALRTSAYHAKFVKRFMAEVDIALSLTTAGFDQIREKFPELQHARFCVGHHPHYRSVLGEGNYSPAERAKLGIKPEQRTFSFIGSLRPNKRPELVAGAFRSLAPDGYFLLMSGSASPELTAQISALAAGRSNIRLDFRRIPEDEVIALYAATDIMVFPGTDYLNSGTIYTALSLNTPVIAAWTPVNAEIQQMVGAEWLSLYKGDFSPAALEEGARTLIRRGPGVVCDLERFSPESCAHEHLAAYALDITENSGCCRHAA